VIVQAIREARRTIDGLPTAAAFLKICEAQRDRFWEWSEDVDMLIELRRQAEDYLAAENRKLIPAPEPGDDAWSSIGLSGARLRRARMMSNQAAGPS
jgi:hypothetical protein